MNKGSWKKSKQTVSLSFALNFPIPKTKLGSFWRNGGIFGRIDFSIGAGEQREFELCSLMTPS